MKPIKYSLACLLIAFLLGGCVKKEASPREEAPAPLQSEEKEEAYIPTVFEVEITANKTMVPKNLSIKKGDSVRWYNNDKKFNHNILIYPADIARPAEEDITAQSGNIAPGTFWKYTFEKSGEYAVKDIYSGTMTGKITAEIVSENLGKQEVIGRISVE
jgi:plastocyanin